MTQKRGLGRGLGALIPGAGSAPAPEQELRTRTRPTAGSDGEAGGVRPVDMFFSGEQVSREEEKAQRERAGARDLATGMARAAAERRGRTGSSGGRRSAAARAAASAPEEESAQPTAADAPARTGSRSRKAGSGTTRSAASAASSSGTSSGATSSGTRSTGTRSSSTKSAATKSAASKSAGTKSAGSRSEGTKAAAGKSTGSKAAAGKSTGSKAAGSTSAGTKAGRSTTTATKSTTKRAASSSKTSSAAKDAPATPPSPAATTSKAATPTRTQASEPAQVEQPLEEPTAAVPAEAAAERPAPSSTQEQPAPSAADAASAAGSSREDSPVVDVEEVISTPAQQEPVEEVPAPASSEQDVAAQSSRPDDAAPETVAEDGAEDEEPVEEALEEAAGDRGLVSVPGAEFAEIPIHEVRENPRNPRTMFDDDELDELAHSLREVGVLQPVVVRPISVTADGESFELVMGERRWRAARRAGLESIPAIIRETSDDDLLRDALLENLHRSQLNPLEEANAYQQLLDDFGCTQDELGDRIGRSRPQITNTLRLLRLPALVQRRLASGALSAGHARALLSLDDPRLMEELAQRIVQEGLSVRAVERLVARGGQQQTTRTVRRSTYDPHVVDLTSRLSNRLETPVRIDVGKRKGRITLEFTNLDDLERLVENIGLDVSLPSGDDRSDG